MNNQNQMESVQITGRYIFPNAQNYYFLEQEIQNELNVLATEGWKMFRGITEVDDAYLNQLAKILPNFHIETGNKRLAFIPKDTNKLYVIMIPFYAGMEGIKDNYCEEKSAQYINQFFLRRGWIPGAEQGHTAPVPTPLASYQVNGVNNFMLVEERFSNTLNSLVRSGTINQKLLLKNYVDNILKPQSNYLTDLTIKISKAVMIADLNTYSSPMNQGTNGWGVLGYLDIGSCVSKWDEVTQQHWEPVCQKCKQGLLIYIPDSMEPDVLDNINVATLTSSTKPKYICSHCLKELSTQDELYEAVENFKDDMLSRDPSHRMYSMPVHPDQVPTLADTLAAKENQNQKLNNSNTFDVISQITDSQGTPFLVTSLTVNVQNHIYNKLADQNRNLVGWAIHLTSGNIVQI